MGERGDEGGMEDWNLKSLFIKNGCSPLACHPVLIKCVSTFTGGLCRLDALSFAQ